MRDEMADEGQKAGIWSRQPAASHFSWLIATSSYMTLLWRATERFRAANFSGRANRGCSRRADGFEATIFPGKRRMANPFEFIQQVRSEASKVIWPTRRETLITTGMVLLMVVFASLFFVTVDEALRLLVGLVLGIGRHG
jgi:preprotein translocase subunit SecE